MLKNKAILFLFFFSLESSAESTLLTNDRYKSFRESFMDISQGIYEIDINKLDEQEYRLVTSNLNQSFRSPMKHKYGFSFDEREISTFTSFGRPGACRTFEGDKALCYDATGGTLGGFYDEKTKGHCGSKLGFGSSLPITGSDVNKICDKSTLPVGILKDNKVPWGGYRFWLGLYNDDLKVNSGYLRDKIPNASGKPLNRMCFEMEFDVNNMHIISPESDLDTGKRVLVNGSLAPKLANIGINLGTYTAPIMKDILGSETSGNEVGGIFGSDESHFYHLEGNYPNDKAYAIDERTLIYCAGDQPIGVRVSMLSGFVNNPLADMFPNDENGNTNGLNYWNYVTRLYANIRGLGQMYVNYPYRTKLKRIFMLYEKNDILMLAEDGKSTVSNKFTLAQEYSGISHATHKVLLRNFSINDRDYRFYQNSNSQTPDELSGSKFQVYIDTNKNGKIDAADKLLTPYETFSVKANTDIIFLARQENYFNLAYNRTIRHVNNRRVINNKFGIREVGRLRSAGITIRTWEILPSETLDTSKFLKFAGYNDYSARIKPVLLKKGLTYGFTVRINKKPATISVELNSPTIEELASKIQSALSVFGVTTSVIDDYIKLSGSYKRFSFVSLKNFRHAYAFPDNDRWFLNKDKNHYKENSPYSIKNTIEYRKHLGGSPKKPKSINVN